MMVTAGILVSLGQDDPLITNLVDSSDMLSIRTNHLLMFASVIQRIALSIARISPSSEILFEFQLVFSTVISIFPI